MIRISPRCSRTHWSLCSGMQDESYLHVVLCLPKGVLFRAWSQCSLCTLEEAWSQNCFTQFMRRPLNTTSKGHSHEPSSKDAELISDNTFVATCIFKRLLGSRSQHLSQISHNFFISYDIFRGFLGCFPSMIASMTRVLLIS